MVFWREYKLTPSMAMLNRRLHTLSLNLLSHVFTICFMAIESTGIHITPFSLLCEACHLCNSDNCLQWKSLWIFGVIGMCLNILWEGPCSLCLIFYSWYLSCPHFGHLSLLAYASMYKMKSFRHSWYDMYTTPNIFSILFASVELLGKPLLLRSTFFFYNLELVGNTNVHCH